jgi:hypothetical protein
MMDSYTVIPSNRSVKSEFGKAEEFFANSLLLACRQSICFFEMERILLSNGNTVKETGCVCFAGYLLKIFSLFHDMFLRARFFEVSETRSLKNYFFFVIFSSFLITEM